MLTYSTRLGHVPLTVSEFEIHYRSTTRRRPGHAVPR